MGNTPITIGVETDKTGYTAGSTLHGKVYLSISSRQSTGVAAQVLQLRLLGRESAVVHHTSTSDSNTDNHYERSSHTFFQVDYPLYSFVNQRAPSGQYEYPFQFNLPPNLPSTMKARDGESTCEVEYELIATLVQPGGGGIFQGHPNGKKTISVWSTTVEPADSSVQHPEDNIPVNGCCCFQKGNMLLESCVDKTIVKHNDMVQVQFKCQNNSSLDVESVKIQLEQIIQWTCNSRSKKVRRILDKLEVDSRRYPELEPTVPKSGLWCCFGVGGGRTGGSHSYAQLNTNSNTTSNSSQDYHTFHLRIPENANDTYQGNAVSIQHVLSVVLVSNGCCNSNPESATTMQLFKSFSNGDNKTSEHTPAMVATSAQQDILSFDSTNNNTADAAPVFATAELAPATEVQTLPSDWNAQTAQVVEIPMAEAMLVEPSAPPMFK
ncbi:unnamed protein product [Cylindrotheca closterium]|uniref:Arrestin-like N-terminal domain-containing protein n=1 Tax=Cylindrotheca closterium TaxID=2856 RepID=A0AAD2FU14_9STRA|nr:unnamed protein product [Cylindrotheca closterium]